MGIRVGVGCGECSDEIDSCLDDIGGYITVCICQNLENLTKIVSVSYRRFNGKKTV